jgi:hypothetical protein
MDALGSLVVEQASGHLGPAGAVQQNSTAPRTAAASVLVPDCS